MPVSLSEQTILLVDDEESSRAMVRQMLRRVGFGEVMVASDGYRAVDVLNHHKIDAVLTDFRMPGMHGLSLLKAIRTGKTAADRNLPCAMLTSYAERHLVGLAIVLDVDTFLAKPVALEVLAKHMARMFQYRFEPQSVAEYAAIDVEHAAPHLTESQPRPVAPPPEEPPKELVAPLPVDERQLAEHQQARLKEQIAAADKRARPHPDKAADKTPEPARAREASRSSRPAAKGAPAQPARALPQGRAIKVALGDVPENAVLAKDLFGAGGTLLLAAGTPFKSRYMKRLEDLSAINEGVDSVWIFEPAGA